jgi:hypothetical protein
MKCYVAGVLALASGLVLAADTQKAIPKQFLGEWGASKTSCLKHNTDDVDTDDLEMRIEPSRISFYESSGKVLAVATSGELELALILELSGEGETWLGTKEFRLSADMNTITDVKDHQNSPVRVRCLGTARK